MRVVIIGSGGVGGYFGGVLAEAGYDVTLLARGDHLTAIKAHGLKIELPGGDVLSPTVKVIGLTDSADPFDLVIVAVKGWQLDDAMPQIQRLSHQTSVILPLLNGIDATDVLRDGLSDRLVAAGLCGIIAAIKEPGVITHIALDPFITFGVFDESDIPVKDLKDIKVAFEAAGIKTNISSEIKLSMWRKFLFICPLSAVTSVARATIGKVRSVPETSALLHQCIDEVISVGRAAGIKFTDQHRTDVLKSISEAPADGTTSMQRDILTARPSELETQVGAVIKLGKSHSIPTPALSFIYSALLPQELAVR